MLSKTKKHFKLIFNKFLKVNSDLFKGGEGPTTLTDTQKLFIVWNAERLGISNEESQERYFSSWSSIDGGHTSQKYRQFNNLSYKLFEVFFSDKGNEVYTAYEYHSYMHFLRMLSYYEPTWDDNNVIVEHLLNQEHINILDYGCGLAQASRSLAVYLKSKGKPVNLYLVDIPTIRKEFLLWVGKRTGVETSFLESTIDTPIPELPSCNICIATEFFEHVYNPLMYFEKINSSLASNGYLITNIADHGKEFMHVSPSLQLLREKIVELKYDEIKENQIFKKNN